MEWLNRILKKDLTTFIKFSVVGAIWTVANVAMDIAFVKYLNLPSWFGTLLSYFILYVGRYYSYLALNVIQPQFWKYAYSTIAFTAVIYLLKNAAVYMFNLPIEYASPIIAALAFVLKYPFYKSINLISNKDD